MADEEPLYQDGKLKIDYLPKCVEDHELFIKDRGSYALPRGVLQDLARTPRGGIGRILDTFNPSILDTLNQEGIDIDGLHIALCQAYMEGEKRIRETPPPHLGE